MESYYEMILWNYISESPLGKGYRGCLGRPGAPWDPRDLLGTPLGPPGTPLGRRGTPLGPPGTPLGRPGTPLGPQSTPLGLPDTPLGSPGTPGDVPGPLGTSWDLLRTTQTVETQQI